jgi:ABC-type lipoprotein release transport system permease subunit
VFGASLTHLTRTPSLYGQPYNLTFNATGQSPTLANQMLASLERDRAISGLNVGINSGASINGKTVQALLTQTISGQLEMTTTNGRFPTTADEVALGATTLRQIGAHLGSVVRIAVSLPQGGSRTSAFRVVGTVVFPLGSSGGFGVGAAFPLSGVLDGRCAPGPSQKECIIKAAVEAGGSVVVRAVPGPKGQAALARLARQFPAEVTYPVAPTNLVNFGEAVNFPLLFGLVLIVFGVSTLLHVLMVSVVRRRREVGLLKALGFMRRQVALTVFWQTTTLALIGIVIGVPAGIAVGRTIWLEFAKNLGVLPEAVVIASVIVAVAVGTLIIANVLALGPAIMASRSRPASLLKAE